MTFTFQKIDSIETTVKFSSPDPTGKRKKLSNSLQVEFTKLTVSELNNISDRLNDPEDEYEAQELMRENIINISGVLDPDGNEVEFSNNLLEMLIDTEYVLSPLVESFFDLQRTKKAKN
jgi:hypothetical protein|tara:strand:+ start:5437 stop:5793 length:357 start_codon:yes stop_codon:yes gene_type:complete